MHGSSTALMTAIDVVMVILAVLAAASLRRRREGLKATGRDRGLPLSLVGLVLLAAFFAADLVARWVLPLAPGSDPMEWRSGLRQLEASWLWLAAAVGCVSVGLMRGARDRAELAEEHQQLSARALESEERFRRLSESTFEGVVVSRGGVIVDANGRFVELVGRSREELVGLRVADLVPEQDRQEVEERLLQRVEDTSEFTALRPDGTTLPVRVRARHLDLEGETLRITSVTDLSAEHDAIVALRESERELLASQQQQQALSRQLIELLEAERSHLARELHDEAGQALTAIKMNLQAVRREVSGERTLKRIDDALDISDETIAGLRRLALNLRPSLLDDLGLVTALRWLTEKGGRPSELEIVFDAEELQPRPDPQIETACFRIAQEALTNVYRHSGARHAEVSLRHHGGGLELRVSDDGAGFDAESLWRASGPERRLGILGMRERAQLVGGELEVESAPGRGTAVVARFGGGAEQPPTD